MNSFGFLVWVVNENLISKKLHDLVYSSQNWQTLCIFLKSEKQYIYISIFLKFL